MMLGVIFLSCLVLIGTSAAPNPDVNKDVDIKVNAGSANKGSAKCRRTDMCKSASGVCQHVDDTCSGSIIGNGCRGGRHCVCCAGQAVLDVECGIETPAVASNRIVNGGVVNIPRQYSWQVGVYIEWNHGHPGYINRCGGSIINDKYVLTAGHCLYQTYANGTLCVLIPNRFYVGIGNNKRSDTVIYIEVIDKILNNYNCNTYKNDIALLELKQSISGLLASGYIHPICLPSDDTNDYAGKSAIVTGWGKIAGYNHPRNKTPNPPALSPDTLKEALVPVISNGECIKDVPFLTANMLCISTGNGFEAGANGTCQGDSGGPLTYKETKQHVQIGVVSFSRGCTSNGNPGVYARVSKYLMWIELMAGKIYKIT